MAITASRGGVTSPNWYQVGIPVGVHIVEGSLALSLHLDSKGGGTSDVRVSVGPSDFEELMSGMLDTDFDATMKAFARACQKWRKHNAKAKTASA